MQPFDRGMQPNENPVGRTSKGQRGEFACFIQIIAIYKPAERRREAGEATALQSRAKVM